MKMKLREAVALFLLLDKAKLGGMTAEGKISVVRTVMQLADVHRDFVQSRQRLAASLLTDDVRTAIQTDSALAARIENEFNGLCNKLIDSETDAEIRTFDQADFDALMDANPDVTAGEWALFVKLQNQQN